MRLEWIEDILAVMDAGSLARAAEMRSLTQSAFTRRIRKIEDSIGSRLLDRSRKPVEVLPAVRAMEPELRDAMLRLDSLRMRLRDASGSAGTPVTFACQHAITTTVSPRFVTALLTHCDASARVRSANRDACLMMLLSGKVDFALMYAAPGAGLTLIPAAFDSVVLEEDHLVPVCTPAMRDAVNGPVVPIVSYPPEVFFGQVFSKMLAPNLPGGVTTASKAETALTLAAYRYALGNIGVAWLPRSLVQEALERGDLCGVSDRLPTCALDLKMIWLSEPHRPKAQRIRQTLLDHLYPDRATTRG